MKRIPVASPVFSSEEELAVSNVIRSGWVTMGPKVLEFEELFAKYTSTKYAIAMFNGTVTLHSALIALGIGPGDEVIVPSLTYISTANAVLYVGAKLVLCDSNPQTYNVELTDIKKVITKRTKAIITVDMQGMPIDYENIMNFANQKNISVISDSAESIGATYKNNQIGSQAHIHSFSFFGNKNITTGEGGMLTTNSESLMKKLKIIRNQGQEERYKHIMLGYNYRMTECQAALGIVQLKTLKNRLKLKEKIIKNYNSFFSKCDLISIPNIPNYVTNHAWYMYTISLDKTLNRDLITKELDKIGIETRVSFPPVHIQPFYVEKFGFKEDDFPNCMIGWKQLINLPISPNLPLEDLNYVAENVIKLVQLDSQK